MIYFYRDLRLKGYNSKKKSINRNLLGWRLLSKTKHIVCRNKQLSSEFYSKVKFFENVYDYFGV